MDLGVDLYDPRTYLAGLPLEAFARLRRECPVYWQEERAILDWPAGRGYWAITRYADVERVNRNPELFSSHLGATQIRDPKPEDLDFQRKMMLNLDPPAHSRLRSSPRAARSSGRSSKWSRDTEGYRLRASGYRKSLHEVLVRSAEAVALSLVRSCVAVRSGGIGRLAIR